MCVFLYDWIEVHISVIFLSLIHILRYFSYIHPCGFMDKGVTSLQKELGCEVPMEEVAGRVQNELSELL